MHLRQILQMIKRAVILPWICIEPSNFQVRFRSKAAFCDWYFYQYHCFILGLVTVIYIKFWWNKIASSMARCFTINGQFYLYFPKVKPVCAYFWVMIISLFALFCFTTFFQNFKGLLFFSLGGHRRIIFSMFYNI